MLKTPALEITCLQKISSPEAIRTPTLAWGTSRRHARGNSEGSRGSVATRGGWLATAGLRGAVLREDAFDSFLHQNAASTSLNDRNDALRNDRAPATRVEAEGRTDSTTHRPAHANTGAWEKGIAGEEEPNPPRM